MTITAFFIFIYKAVIGYAHIAPFSFLSVLLLKTLPVHIAQFSNKYTTKTIGAPDRRSHCSSKTILLIPFSKQSLLLISIKKVPMVTLNVIVINSLLAKECEPFLDVSAFGFTLKTDRFQNAPFSNSCVFISVFEKPRFQRIAM